MTQLRSSRLMEDHFMKSDFANFLEGSGMPDHVKRMYALQGCFLETGDTMTGWEIIAGLPLEEQLKVDLGWPYFVAMQPLVDAWVKHLGGTSKDRIKHDLGLCGCLYRWNGESWEVVE